MMNVWIPKELMENGLYSKMSNGAKTLYGILINLKKDAERKEWIDERGYRYVLFPKKKMQEQLNCSRYSADLFMKELEVLDLIRLGYCITPIIEKRIYVRNIEDADAEIHLACRMAGEKKSEENNDFPEQASSEEEEKNEDHTTTNEEETAKEILNLAEDLIGLVTKMIRDDKSEKA